MEEHLYVFFDPNSIEAAGMVFELLECQGDIGTFREISTGDVEDFLMTRMKQY